MNPELNDTIVALSSAPAGGVPLGEASRAILRLSGPRAFSLAGAVFSPSPEDILRGGAERAWRRVAGEVLWREKRIAACAYLMPGPHSYTRQDIVELHIPAAPLLVAALLDALLAAGARAALPGEFTRRAFLNGRLSLAQAEAVGALIRAETADAARSWAARATGHRPGSPGALRAATQDLLALVELGLDFSHEDVVLISRAELLRRIEQLVRRAENAAAQAGAEASGLLAGEQPRVVLAGPVNAGKSSLFNALLGREEALVASTSHTTRDVVEASATFGAGCAVRLLDTAGLYQEWRAGDPGARQAVDGAELLRQALDATLSALRAADVVLLVGDASLADPAQWVPASLLPAWGERPPPVCAIVWSKADLPRASNWSECDAALAAAVEKWSGGVPVARLCVSSRTGAGLPELRAFIAREGERLAGRVSAAHAAGEAAVRSSALRAGEALRRAETAAREALGEDAVALELREAMHALSAAEGVWLAHDKLTEALLDRIFSTFCVGK